MTERRTVGDASPAAFAPAFADCDVAFAILAGPQLAVTFANPAHTRLCGSAPELAAEVQEAARTVFRAGQPVRLAEVPVNERFLQVVCSPVRHGSAITGVSVVSVDVTGHVRARRRAEARHHRLSVLDEATTAVTAELDPRREFIALAESVVPALADACAIYLVDRRQGIRVATSGVLHATRLVCVINPELGFAPPAPEIRIRLAPTRPVAKAATTGDLVITRDSQADPRGWGEHWLTLLDPHSFVAVPIGEPDEVLAVISFAATSQRAAYSDADIALMREITTRLDVAVGHALRLQRTSEVALTLQRGLLSEPPEVEGVDIRGCYRPAGPGLEVGGDWYDAVLLPGGSLAVTVGDVVGHDLEAASTMGQLRSMVQALACQPDAQPAGVLSAINRLTRHLRVGEMATVIHGQLTPATGLRPARFTWANAGHPPPILIGPGNTVTVLERTAAPLLGLADTTYSQDSVDVPGGAVLMLYTDGLMEDPERPEADTIAELAEAALKLVAAGMEELCDRLIAGAPTRDDIALLAIRPAS